MMENKFREVSKKYHANPPEKLSLMCGLGVLRSRCRLWHICAQPVKNRPLGIRWYPYYIGFDH